MQQATPYRLKPEWRKERRQSASISCTVLWDGLYEYATIRDISIYGAQLEGFCFPPVGTRISIIAEGLEICATIIWLGDNKCGVLLAREVDPVAFIRRHSIREISPREPSPVNITQISFRRYA